MGTDSSDMTYAAQVVEVSDYYPFGSPLYGRRWEPVKPLYRFGFNTQEKVNEISPDHYTAKYWEYDARLGRRWNLDPKPQAGVSNYAVNMDNPIRWNDPDGDIVGGDEKGMQNYNKYRKEVNDRIGAIKNEMAKIDNPANEMFGKLKEQLDAYTKINVELDKLEKDPNNLYYIRSDVKFENTVKGGQTYYAGEVEYDKKKIRQINIDIAPTNFPLNPLAHEFKHAYQYYEGRLIFMKGTKEAFNSRELEKEAFERGNRFSGPTIYNNNKFNMLYKFDFQKFTFPNEDYEKLDEKVNPKEIIYNPLYKNKIIYNEPQ